jgi:hypothetical protein
MEELGKKRCLKCLKEGERTVKLGRASDVDRSIDLSTSQSGAMTSPNPSVSLSIRTYLPESIEQNI